MTETAARPADALNEQDLEAVSAGLSLPGLAGTIIGAVRGGVTPGVVTSAAQMLGLTGISAGGVGPGPSALPIALQGGCPVQLSSTSE